MNTERPLQLRQGDVLLQSVREIPAEAVKAPDCVVAQGTATGHCHRFPAGAEQWVLGAGEKREQFIRVTEPTADLCHLRNDTAEKGEHDPITVPHGDYKVVHQREWIEERDAPVID